MDRGGFDSRKRTGSVKAAVNMYGEQIHGGKPELKKTQMEFSEPSSRTRELHLAKRDIGRFNENRKYAESEKAQAELELFNAKKLVKELTSRIEESKSKAKARNQDLEVPKKPERHEDGWASTVGKNEKYQYAKVMRELEFVKQELSKLKLDMASVLEAKTRADKEMEASTSRMWSYSSSMEALRKEIEEANEEHVLVELARIEALREFGAIEAQKEAEAAQFSSTLEKTRKRINNIIQEIDRAKELETKLAITTSDVNVLQNELKLVKAMDKRVQGNESSEHSEVSKQMEDESETSSLLQSTTEELEAAKKELACIREEGFQFMASMDIIREELKHVSQETARLKNLEEKTDITVHNLNSKLLRAKSKLEAASAAEEKAKAIVSNLSLTLQQLKTEEEAAKKERELINDEALSIRAEIEKTELEIDLAEERLEAAMQELEAVKSSEAIALENLKTLTENTMMARSSASQHDSSITISKFEYDYLTGRAEEAEEIADKKVAAAQAWIEALKASEKEILMKIEIAHREKREIKVGEEQEVYRAEKSLMAKRAVEDELHNWRQQREKNTEAANLQREMPLLRKSVRENGSSTPARREKPRRPSSPGARYITHSTSINLRRRKKVMPNLVKFFSSKKTDR